MTADHSSYEELAAQRRDSDEYRQGYAEARRAFLIGQAVRERRLALGLSQAELATRAGVTRPPRHPVPESHLPRPGCASAGCASVGKCERDARRAARADVRGRPVVRDRERDLATSAAGAFRLGNRPAGQHTRAGMADSGVGCQV